MGRLLKRVALDFDYPINKTWTGFLNPNYKKCPHCQNGYTPARIRLQSIVNLLMLSGSDSLKNKNHPYFNSIRCFDFNIIPSKELADLTGGLAGRNPDGLFGHDVCDRWSAEKKIIEAGGLDSKTWGICEHCKGDAIDPDIKQKYDDWKPTEPPTGEGFQLWENTSEGSPQSPVFKTLEELSEWCAENATVFADIKNTKEEWLRNLSGTLITHKEGNMIFI